MQYEDPFLLWAHLPQQQLRCSTTFSCAVDDVFLFLIWFVFHSTVLDCQLSFLFFPWITFYSTTWSANRCWQLELRLQQRQLSEQSVCDRPLKAFYHPVKSRHKRQNGLRMHWGNSPLFWEGGDGLLLEGGGWYPFKLGGSWEMSDSFSWEREVPLFLICI